MPGTPVPIATERPASMSCGACSIWISTQARMSSAFNDAFRARTADVDDLLPVADYFTYESRIEEGVHGYVHCTTGPTCPVADTGS